MAATPSHAGDAGGAAGGGVEHLRHGLEATSALYERRLDQLTARLAETEARAAAEGGGEARVARR